MRLQRFMKNVKEGFVKYCNIVNTMLCKAINVLYIVSVVLRTLENCKVSSTI